MKHHLVIFFTACVSLVACVKSEVPSADAGQQPVSFNDPVVESMSKAVYGEVSSPYPTAENYCVFACWAPEGSPLKNGTWSPSAVYMSNVEVQWGGVSADYWSSGNVPGGADYYWPKQGTLSFAAYSPASVKSYAPEYGSSGLTVTGFEIPSSVSDQYDFMYSSRVYDQTKETSPADGVDIMFHHALSSVKFKVKTLQTYLDEGTALKIIGLRVCNAAYKADFNEHYDETADKPGAKWENYDSGRADYLVWSGEQALTSTEAQLASHPDVLLMPQNMVKDAYDKVRIEIDYKIKNKFGEEITVTKPVDFTGSWEMGKRYVYTLTLELAAVNVELSVSGWGIG